MKIKKTKEYLIKLNTNVCLKQWDPNAPLNEPKKSDDADFKEFNEELEKLQEILYAEHQHKILVIFQGMDTSGKDGAIQHIFKGINPAHVRVVSFKEPTALELDHDFLWRVHSQVPAKGELVIFNRSHYEDVLIARVHGLVPKKVWKRRYDHINAFEKLLVDEGTLVYKFFLHIDKQEQKKRLLERLKDRQKEWKFNPNDLKEREFWNSYQTAYEDVLNQTSTKYAPWYLIPANQKWYRNWIISKILVSGLEKLKMKFPKRSSHTDHLRIV